MVLFAFKDDEVLQKILKFVAHRNTKRNYFLVLTVYTKIKSKLKTGVENMAFFQILRMNKTQ